MICVPPLSLLLISGDVLPRTVNWSELEMQCWSGGDEKHLQPHFSGLASASAQLFLQYSEVAFTPGANRPAGLKSIRKWSDWINSTHHLILTDLCSTPRENRRFLCPIHFLEKCYSLESSHPYWVLSPGNRPSTLLADMGFVRSRVSPVQQDCPDTITKVPQEGWLDVQEESQPAKIECKCLLAAMWLDGCLRVLHQVSATYLEVTGEA